MRSYIFPIHISRGGQTWDYVSSTTLKSIVKEIREYQKHYHNKRTLVVTKKGVYGVYSRSYMKRGRRKK